MLQARSLGKRAGEILSRPPITGQVLASFARVCDLLTDRGQVLALAWDSVPNGPLNILLANRPGTALPAGTRFVVSGKVLQFFDKGNPIPAVDLTGARSWDPGPDWRDLAAGRKQILARSAVVAALLAAAAPAGSLACLLPPPNASANPIHRISRIRRRMNSAPPGPRLAPMRRLKSAPDTPNPINRISADGAFAASVVLAHLPVAARAIGDLQAAYARLDLTALGAAAARLCGLGPGLTPSGDDWLAGWLIGLRIRGDKHRVERAGQIILEVAIERTNLLSRAFLACAAAGELDETWQGLLSALRNGPDEKIAHATRAILACGQTSGADMLAGFLDALTTT